MVICKTCPWFCQLCTYSLQERGPAQFWQSGWGAFLAIANLSTKSESERALFSVLLFSWQALWANFLKRAQLHCWGTFTQYSFWLSWQPLRGVKKALHCAVFQALRITMAQWWWVHQLFKRYNTIMTSSEIWQKCHLRILGQIKGRSTLTGCIRLCQ